MSLDASTVRAVAALAHLHLTGEEETHLAEELNHILGHIVTLQQVDTSGVDSAGRAMAREETLAADIALPSLPRADVLRAAPDADVESGVFCVPRVV